MSLNHLYASLLLLAILYLLYSHMNVRERFSLNLTNLKKGIGAEKCEILIPPVSDPKVTNIMESGRIRSWKPTTGVDKTYNEYCFTNMNDPFMADKSCSKDSKIFESTPFIKSVRLDDTLTQTKYAKDQKCVMEIDRSKVNEKSLNDWWTTWTSENECEQINKKIINTNIYLKKEKQKSIETLEELVNTKRTNENIIAQLIQEIKEMGIMLKNKEEIVNKLTTEYNQLLAKMNEINDQFVKVKKTSEDIMTNLRNKKVKVDIEHADIKNIWDELNNKIKILEREKELNRKQYLEMQIKYSNMMKEFSKKQKEYEIKFQTFQSLRDENTTCQAELKTETENYSRCKINLDSRKIVLKNEVIALQNCQVLKKKCDTDTAAALRNLEEAKKELEKIKIAKEKCYREYNKCMAALKEVEASYQIEKENFAESRRLRPYESCKQFTDKTKTNKEYIIKCNRNEKDVQDYKKQIIDIQKLLNGMNTDSCEKAIADLRVNNIAISHLLPCNGGAASCQSCEQLCKTINGREGTAIGTVYDLGVNPNGRNACICQYVGTKNHIPISQRNNDNVVNNWLFYNFNIRGCNGVCRRFGHKVHCDCHVFYRDVFKEHWDQYRNLPNIARHRLMRYINNNACFDDNKLYIHSPTTNTHYWSDNSSIQGC